MARVSCLYCGKKIADDVARCPHCAAVSHFQRRGYRVAARRRFLFIFAIIALLSLFFALWLPR